MHSSTCQVLRKLRNLRGIVCSHTSNGYLCLRRSSRYLALKMKKRDTPLWLLEVTRLPELLNISLWRADVTYALLKLELEQLFSGEDYRRAIETKVRALYLRNTNIPLFCNQLRFVIGKLFQITDTATVEKLAINDVMSKLGTALREPQKMLQLAGTCKLEVLLELAKSKMVVNIYLIPMIVYRRRLMRLVSTNLSTWWKIWWQIFPVLRLTWVPEYPFFVFFYAFLFRDDDNPRRFN